MDKHLKIENPNTQYLINCRQLCSRLYTELQDTHGLRMSPNEIRFTADATYLLLDGAGDNVPVKIDFEDTESEYTIVVTVTTIDEPKTYRIVYEKKYESVRDKAAAIFQLYYNARETWASMDANTPKQRPSGISKNTQTQHISEENHDG